MSSELGRAIESYKDALGKIESLTPGSPEADQQIIGVLTARDAVQAALDNQSEADVSDIKLLSSMYDDLESLDKRLNEKGTMIASTVRLNEWANRLKIPGDTWWWSFLRPMDRLDWIWNAVTVVSIALATSFVINIYSALSVGSASIATTFTMIMQAAGLAAIGGGALSQSGQQFVQNLLPKLGIPKRFFAEITCVAAITFAGILFLTSNYMDTYYHKTGDKYYDTGELASAEEFYLKGLQINSTDNEFNESLGKVYESLGNLEQAVQYYHLSVQGGQYDSLNDLGRAYINRVSPVTRKADPALAEAVLLLGLQRAESKKASEILMYELARNIGWATLNQKKYTIAKAYLDIAIKSEKKISEKKPGSGIAYCFLAQVYEEQGDKEKAIPLWQECMKNAYPEFLHEYKWFFDIKQDRIAYCVNTQDVLSSYDSKKTALSKEVCDALYDELGASLKLSEAGTKEE
ncbi:MAG: tetratricopeptide repeat protein [Desulfobacterales bacterium]|nr:tetratricopeptide repeat protein [Desulfobacterales bacterium]